MKAEFKNFDLDIPTRTADKAINDIFTNFPSNLFSSFILLLYILLLICVFPLYIIYLPNRFMNLF